MFCASLFNLLICCCGWLQRVRVVPTDKLFAFGTRPLQCSTGDVCMALDYLEDPLAHGITKQVPSPPLRTISFPDLQRYAASFAQRYSHPTTLTVAGSVVCDLLGGFRIFVWMHTIPVLRFPSSVRRRRG